jgi:hypothetical protein
VLEDDFHAERLRTYQRRDQAVADLRRLEHLTRSELAKEIGPTPCADHCGRRELHIIEDTGGEIGRARVQDERESLPSG